MSSGITIQTTNMFDDSDADEPPTGQQSHIDNNTSTADLVPTEWIEEETQVDGTETFHTEEFNDKNNNDHDNALDQLQPLAQPIDFSLPPPTTLIRRNKNIQCEEKHENGVHCILYVYGNADSSLLRFYHENRSSRIVQRNSRDDSDNSDDSDHDNDKNIEKDCDKVIESGCDKNIEKDSEKYSKYDRDMYCEKYLELDMLKYYDLTDEFMNRVPYSRKMLFGSDSNAYKITYRLVHTDKYHLVDHGDDYYDRKRICYTFYTRNNPPLIWLDNISRYYDNLEFILQYRNAEIGNIYCTVGYSFGQKNWCEIPTYLEMRNRIHEKSIISYCQDRFFIIYNKKKVSMKLIEDIFAKFKTDFVMYLLHNIYTKNMELFLNFADKIIFSIETNIIKYYRSMGEKAISQQQTSQQQTSQHIFQLLPLNMFESSGDVYIRDFVVSTGNSFNSSIDNDDYDIPKLTI